MENREGDEENAPRAEMKEGEWMIMVESGEVEMVWRVSCKKKKKKNADWEIGKGRCTECY